MRKRFEQSFFFFGVKVLFSYRRVVALPILHQNPGSGKVLIVQRDANVKKLALIKIYAVRDADVIRWKKDLNERLRLAVETIHRFQKESAAAEAEISRSSCICSQSVIV